MAQFFIGQRGPIFAVLVDEGDGRVNLAQFNSGDDAVRTTDERLAAMKRLYLKMEATYPNGDVDLVEIVPFDADAVDGDIPVEAMGPEVLRREVRRLRAKLASKK